MSSDYTNKSGEAINHVDNNIGIEFAETFDSLVLKDHFHNSHEIVFITEGSAEFKINNKKYDVSRNSIIFISNLESHELKVTGIPYRRFLVLIKPDYFNTAVSDPVLASILNHRPGHFNHAINLKEGDIYNVEDIIRKMHAEINNGLPYGEICLKSYLHLLLVTLFRSHGNAFPLSSINRTIKNIIDIRKYIDTHYNEPITLKEIASMFYMDMYYLSHAFKKIIGFSFRDYLILQRISKAKDLLYHTEENIMQVSLNSGFSNINNFIRTFKNYEGITPYQYRKKYRKQ